MLDLGLQLVEADELGAHLRGRRLPRPLASGAPPRARTARRRGRGGRGAVSRDRGAGMSGWKWVALIDGRADTGAAVRGRDVRRLLDGGRLAGEVLVLDGVPEPAGGVGPAQGGE